MNETQLVAALEQIVRDHPAALDDPRSFRGLINDALGEDGRKYILQVNLLVSAVELGIPRKIAESGTVESVGRLAGQLERQFGLSSGNARWAVERFCRTTGVNPPPHQATGYEEPAEPAEERAIPATVGDSSETAATVAHSTSETAEPGSLRRSILARLGIVTVATAAVATLAFLSILALGLREGRDTDSPGPSNLVPAPTPEVTALGEGVSVRAGPSVASEKVGSVAGGGTMQIECVTTGAIVVGVNGPTDLWYKVVEPAGFVSDGFLDTGNQSGRAPGCDPSLVPDVSGLQALPAPESAGTGTTVADIVLDVYYGGSWARSDPDDGNWYNRDNRPPNGIRWIGHEEPVDIACSTSAAAYEVVHTDGLKQTWSQWVRLGDGSWLPSAVTGRGVDAPYPGTGAC